MYCEQRGGEVPKDEFRPQEFSGSHRWAARCTLEATRAWELVFQMRHSVNIWIYQHLSTCWKSAWAVPNISKAPSKTLGTRTICIGALSLRNIWRWPNSKSAALHIALSYLSYLSYPSLFCYVLLRFATLRTLESTLTPRSFEFSMLLLLPLLSGNSDSCMMRWYATCSDEWTFGKKGSRHRKSHRRNPFWHSVVQCCLLKPGFQNLSTWALLGLCLGSGCWTWDHRHSKVQHSPLGQNDQRHSFPTPSFRSVSERFSAEELVSSKLWLDLEQVFRQHFAWKTEHCEFVGLPFLDFEGVLSRRASTAQNQNAPKQFLKMSLKKQ